MSPVSTTTTTAAILYPPSQIRVENRSLWFPKAGHAQVQVLATGLCGSDLHYFSDGRNGDFAVCLPLVLGHEAAGIVTALGPGVSNLVVGQRVAIEAGINCRTCDFCIKGRYNLCKGMRFCSSAARYPHVDGTLQSKLNHPAHILHPYVSIYHSRNSSSKRIYIQVARQLLFRTCFVGRASVRRHSRLSPLQTTSRPICFRLWRWHHRSLGLRSRKTHWRIPRRRRRHQSSPLGFC